MSPTVNISNIAFGTDIFILGCGLPQDDALGVAAVSRGVLLGLQCEGVVVEVEVESGGCEGVYEEEVGEVVEVLDVVDQLPCLKHLHTDLTLKFRFVCCS